MTSIPNPTTSRYTMRTLLEALGLAVTAQFAALILLRLILAREPAHDAALGVSLAFVFFWRPKPRSRRYWFGLAAAVVLVSGLSVAMGSVLKSAGH